MIGQDYPRQGEIWRVDLEPIIGSEIHNHGEDRPCVVISDDIFAALPVRMIVPLTGWQEKFDGKQTLVKITSSRQNGLTKDSVANATQARTVDLRRFRSYSGRLTPEELEAVIGAVGLYIGYR